MRIIRGDGNYASIYGRYLIFIKVPSQNMTIGIILHYLLCFCSYLMGRVELYTGIWWGHLRERNRLEDPGVDERIIFRWVFRKCDVGVWTGSSWFRIGTVGGHL